MDCATRVYTDHAVFLLGDGDQGRPDIHVRETYGISLEALRLRTTLDLRFAEA